MSALAHMYWILSEMPAENSTWVTVFQHGTLGMTELFFLKKKRKILFYLVMLIYPITFPINTNGYIYIIPLIYPITFPKWYLYFILHFAAMISFPCRKGDSPRCSLIVSGAMFQWKISIGSRDSQLLRSFWEFTGDFPKDIWTSLVFH